MWQNIKTNILKAADESVGRRWVKVPTVTKFKTPWYRCKNIGNRKNASIPNIEAYELLKSMLNTKALEMQLIKKFEKLKKIIRKVTPINYKEIFMLENVLKWSTDSDNSQVGYGSLKQVWRTLI